MRDRGSVVIIFIINVISVFIQFDFFYVTTIGIEADSVASSIGTRSRDSFSETFDLELDNGPSLFAALTARAPPIIVPAAKAPIKSFFPHRQFVSSFFLDPIVLILNGKNENKGRKRLKFAEKFLRKGWEKRTGGLEEEYIMKRSIFHERGEGTGTGCHRGR